MSIHPLRRETPDDAVVPQWSLGDRLRKALTISGLSVETMAEVQDVDRTTVSRWMHDKSPVRRSAIMLWAIATGVDQTWLETGTAGLEDQTGGDVVRHQGLEPRTRWFGGSRRLTLAWSVNRELTVDRIPGEFPPDWTPEPVPPVLRVVS